MNNDEKFKVIYHIFSSEQAILQRSDQKAFTLLSILGVFSVFFIVHYTKIQVSSFNLILVFLYFVSVFFSIIFLLLVVLPRIQKSKSGSTEVIKIPPTFFAGIVQFKTPENYAKELSSIFKDQGSAYDQFAHTVFSLATINAYKNKYLRLGIISFVFAISFELLLIVSLYVSLATS